MPVGGAATHNCKSKLPWWRGAGPATAMEDAAFARALNQQRRAAALLQDRAAGGGAGGPRTWPQDVFKVLAKQVVKITPTGNAWKAFFRRA